MGIRGYLAVAAVMATWPLVGLSQDLKILYAEPIELTLPELTSAGAAAKTARTRTSFEAYGRPFALDLESNAQLLSRLPAGRRQTLARFDLYRGQLASRPGTWIRLTRSSTGIYGAVWDGTELLAIAPAHYVQRFMSTPLQRNGTQPYVYRLSDTVSSLSDAYCATDLSRAREQSAPGSAYRRLSDELRALKIAPGETGVLEVALVGDSQFVNAHVDPEEAMMSRINIVDGIFTEQLGVLIRPTHLETTTAAAQPFTTNRAETLLEQFASYRESSTALRARGLAHLFTGRDLEGDTAGIAYLDALCETRIGASLSEGWLDVFTSALVVAHELGHNFGAPHDGEFGSCSTTAPDYLMSPYLNGSSTFSQCSISQMRPRAEAAECVVSAGNPDLSVQTTPTDVQGARDWTLQIPVEVTSPGEFTARDASLTLTVPEGVRMLYSSSTSSCSIGTTVATCQLGDVPPGQSRSYVFEATSSTVGEYEATARVAAANDRNSANDSQAIRISVIEPGDATIAFAADVYSLVIGQPLEVSLAVQTTGTQALGATTVRIDLPGIQVSSVDAPGASCTMQPSIVRCTYPALNASASHPLLIRGTAQYAGSRNLHAEVQGYGDSNGMNNHDFARLSVQALTDVAVSMSSNEVTAIVDAQIETVVQLESRGLQPIEEVVFTIQSNMDVSFDEALPSQGSCEVSGLSISCDIGTMPAGELATVTVRMRATHTGNALLTAVVASPADQDAENNSANAVLHARRLSDVRVSASNYFAGYDAAPLTFSALIVSSGLQSADGVTVTVAVPESMPIEAASMEGSECTFASNVVICERASMPADSFADLFVTVLPAQPGVFTATITATATTDQDPANDAQIATLEINAYVDTRIQVDAPSDLVQMHQPFTIPVALLQNRHQATEVRVHAWWFGAMMRLDLPSIQGASCTQAERSVTCVFERLDAQSRTDFAFGARALERGRIHWNVQASSASDRNWANDAAFGSFVADREGDASVAVGSATISAVAGTSFEYPGITVNALSGLDEIVLEVALPTGVGVSFALLADERNTCYAVANVARCYLGSLETGASRTFRASLYGSAAGTVNGTLRVSAANDRNPVNDVAYFTIQVEAPPDPPPPPPAPPPPPPTNGSGNGAGNSGGGGGGGSSGVMLLLLLAGLSIARHRAIRAK